MRYRNTLVLIFMLLALAALSSQAQICGDYDDNGVRDNSDITAYINFFMTPDGIGPIGESDFDVFERLTMHDYLFLLSRLDHGNWNWEFCFAWTGPYIPSENDAFKLYNNSVFPAGYDSLELAVYLDSPEEILAIEFPFSIRVMGTIPDIGQVTFDPDMGLTSLSDSALGEPGEKALLGIQHSLPIGLTRLGTISIHTEAVDSDRPIEIDWTLMNRIITPAPDNSVIPGAFVDDESKTGYRPVLEPFSCGDIDGSGGAPDISDLTALVEYLFLLGDPPYPPPAANINGQGGVDISDLTALTNYLFVTFGQRPSC
jgi:hypothetical protein